MEEAIRIFSLMAASSLVVAAGLAAQAAPRQGDGPVPIDSGRIDGTFAASGVRAYLGIPYAAPPVRELRWRDPQPVVKWDGIYHADRFGPQCIQPLRRPMTNQYSGAEVSSEDCLYLNVWAGPGVRKAPVIVYIYGGGFFIGSSAMALYSGEAVSKQGVVFVSFNYRVGALGFLAHPALSAESPHKTSGNYGFLDQIAALKWVRRNIAQFGGDPDNVTIVGQSAGSMSVLSLQASPLTKGLFNRAVGMSGAQIGNSNPMQGLREAEAEGLKLQAALKTDSIDQLRLLPADRIVVPRVPGGPRVGPIQDGYVLPAPIDAIFARSEQNDVPLILGFTHDESFGGFGEIKDLQDYLTRASTRFGDRAGEFLALYPAATDAEARAQARAADRDSTMAVGMDDWARAQKAHGHAPIFSYEFSRAHSYAPGVTFLDLDPATAGAYHTSDVPFWLGTLDSFNRYRQTRNWTAADRAFSDEMMRSLVTFARTGNPNTSSLKWPEFDPGDSRLLELGTTASQSNWPNRRKLEFFRTQPSVRPTGGALRD